MQFSFRYPSWSTGTASAPLAWHFKQSQPSAGGGAPFQYGQVFGLDVGSGVGVVIGKATSVSFGASGVVLAGGLVKVSGCGVSVTAMPVQDVMNTSNPHASTQPSSERLATSFISILFYVILPSDSSHEKAAPDNQERQCI